MALWIYRLIISHSFSVPPLFFYFSLAQSLIGFFLLFLLWIHPRLASNSHSSSYLWISCPSTIPLHHGDLLTLSRRYITFLFSYQSTLLKFNDIYIWITSITKTSHLLDLLHEKMIYFCPSSGSQSNKKAVHVTLLLGPVVGGICRETKACFLVPVDRIDKDTLFAHHTRTHIARNTRDERQVESLWLPTKRGLYSSHSELVQL